MSTTTLTSYDLIPYTNDPFPQTHPDRLAVLATLLGLEPPPVEHCHVLELGCAAGSNLIPMAEELPHSTFVGIDLSKTQIDEGRKAIAELGLSNIELHHQSILYFEPASQLFYYVLCHCFYSWLPPDFQEHILAICRHCLQPNGVAYEAAGAPAGPLAGHSPPSVKPMMRWMSVKRIVERAWAWSS